MHLGAFDWELPEDMHPDMFVGDTATWWLNSYPKTEPLFLQIGFPGPHPPYDPTKRFSEPYLKERPAFNGGESGGVGRPSGATEGPAASIIMKSIMTRLCWILNPVASSGTVNGPIISANVSMIDEKVGEILTTLGKAGLSGKWDCYIHFGSWRLPD